MAGDEGGLHAWCATLAWRGDAYAGWQVQPNCVTIQGVIQAALGRFCGVEHPIPVTASGRTDSGVHAEMQLVGFTLPVQRTAGQIQAGINFHTPDDVMCLDVKRMPGDFNPRTWTKSKLYRYRILNRKVRCPFRDGLVWHIKPPLDAESMQLAIDSLIGEHDFSSFRAAGCSAKSPIRRIQEARVGTDVDDEVQIEFEGHGFLRHQVRIMVGTLVEVGLGKRNHSEIERVVSAADRSVAGPTAPAQGLTLVRVDLMETPRF